MGCTNPLKAFPVGFTKNGKIDYKITSQKVHHLEQDKYGNWIKIYDPFVSKFCNSVRMRFLEVPCGHCTECKLARSREWANRMIMECKYHDSNYFLTLTYEDDKLPIAESIDSDTGEVRFLPTLKKTDIQNFVKRLRKHFSDQKIRYYVAGEYGSHTYRPHYHMIAFGLSVDDLQFYKDSEVGDHYFTSETLNKIWNRGYVVVAPVTWETCAYTARYVLKKLYSGEEKDAYAKLNVQPEFCCMSLKPAIGAQYYSDHPGIMDYDFINVSTETGGKKFPPPRYFEKLYERDHVPDELPFWKKLQEDDYILGESHKELELSGTDEDYQEYLQTKSNVVDARIKSLRRKGV